MRSFANFSYNLIGNFAGLIITFACVPIYIEVIGAAKYGILTIFLVSVAYISFLDLGIPRAVTQMTARDSSSSDVPSTAPFANGLWLSILAGVVASFLTYALGILIIRILVDAQSIFHEEAAASVIWLAAVAPVVVLTNFFNGFLQASDGFLELNLTSVLALVLAQICPLLVAVSYGPYLPYLLAALVVPRAALLPALWALCRRRGARMDIAALRWSEALSLLRYGGWTTVSALVGPLMHVSDRYLIAANSGAVAVTRYSVPFQLAHSLISVPAAVQSALFPEQAAATEAQVQSITRIGTRAVAVVMFIAAGTGILLVGAILPFLLRDAYTEQSTDVARIVLIGVWANAVAYVPFSQLQAKGSVRLIAIIHVLELPAYALALYLGLRFFGLSGAAVAFSLRCLIDAAVFNYLAMQRQTDWFALGLMGSGLVICYVLAVEVGVWSLATFVTVPLAILAILAVAYGLTTPEMKDVLSRVWIRLSGRS